MFSVRSLVGGFVCLHRNLEMDLNKIQWKDDTLHFGADPEKGVDAGF